MKRSAVRQANKMLYKALAGTTPKCHHDLAHARQVAHDLLMRSMKMGHQQLAWRRLEMALHLGLVMTDEIQRYFASLPRPSRGRVSPAPCQVQGETG